MDCQGWEQDLSPHLQNKLLLLCEGDFRVFFPVLLERGSPLPSPLGLCRCFLPELLLPAKLLNSFHKLPNPAG